MYFSKTQWAILSSRRAQTIPIGYSVEITKQMMMVQNIARIHLLTLTDKLIIYQKRILHYYLNSLHNTLLSKPVSLRDLISTKIHKISTRNHRRSSLKHFRNRSHLLRTRDIFPILCLNILCRLVCHTTRDLGSISFSTVQKENLTTRDKR